MQRLAISSSTQQYDGDEVDDWGRTQQERRPVQEENGNSSQYMMDAMMKEIQDMGVQMNEKLDTVIAENKDLKATIRRQHEEINELNSLVRSQNKQIKILERMGKAHSQEIQNLRETVNRQQNEISRLRQRNEELKLYGKRQRFGGYCSDSSSTSSSDSDDEFEFSPSNKSGRQIPATLAGAAYGAAVGGPVGMIVGGAGGMLGSMFSRRSKK